MFSDRPETQARDFDQIVHAQITRHFDAVSSGRHDLEKFRRATVLWLRLLRMIRPEYIPYIDAELLSLEVNMVESFDRSHTLKDFSHVDRCILSFILPVKMCAKSSADRSAAAITPPAGRTKAPAAASAQCSPRPSHEVRTTTELVCDTVLGVDLCRAA